MSEIKENDEYLKKLSKERKSLQREGKLPLFTATAGWQFLKSKYLTGDELENPKLRYDRISETLASHVEGVLPIPSGHKKSKWSEIFFDLLWSGKVSPSTPVLSNTGSDKGLPVSCSGSYVGDSIESFYDVLKENAVLTKHGFGTSGYLGDIRPRGSKFGIDGKSTGVVPVFDNFVDMAGKVSQGSQRRGAFAGYIDLMSPDFDEVITYVTSIDDGRNIGFNIYQKDIENWKKGDPETVRRIADVVNMRMTLGKGYIFKPDVANKHLPFYYKDKGLKSYASNLCFSGDTLVATADGREAVRIDQLAMESNGTLKFPVYSSKVENGQWESEIKQAIAFKTGTKDVIRITLSDGSSFKCTADHELALADAGKYVMAKDSLGKILEGFSNTVFQCNPSVTGITICGAEDVYDLTVDDNHNFNIITSRCGSENYGILVHNCTEINLGINEELTFTCVLLSLNLSMYDEMSDLDIQCATIMLDCVVSEFLKKAKNIAGLEKAIKFTEMSRAIGVGVCGFHSYLQKNMIPFESLDAQFKNIEIFKRIEEQTILASKYMAKYLGECELTKGHGVRNASLRAIAPTKSTALIMGGVSEGISPFPQNIYEQSTPAGNVIRINPELLNLMKRKKINTQENIDAIKREGGSIQELPFFTAEEKLVFKTGFEIDQFVIVRYAEQRQKYLDQGQSLNLFFEDINSEYISNVHQKILLSENILSAYYANSIRSKGVHYQNTGECLACQ